MQGEEVRIFNEQPIRSLGRPSGLAPVLAILLARAAGASAAAASPPLCHFEGSPPPARRRRWWLGRCASRAPFRSTAQAAARRRRGALRCDCVPPTLRR